MTATVLAAGIAIIVGAIVATGVATLTGSSDDYAGREGLELRVDDVSREAGVKEVTRTWGARVGDFNANGRDDLLLARHKRGIRLYRNDGGGRFVDEAESSFPPIDMRKPWKPDAVDPDDVVDESVPRFELHRDRHDCLFGDVNQSGRKDILCTIGGQQGNREPNPNELWIQQPDGSFVERAREYGVDEPFGRGRFAAFIDANGDEWPDLFIGNQPGREDGLTSINRLFINEDGERFRNAPEYGLEQDRGADSAQAIDFDGDGWEDLLICGADGGPAVLYRNLDGEGFEKVNHRIEGPKRCRFAYLADVDGDEKPDLILLSDGGLTVRLQRDEAFGAPDYEYQVTRGKRLAVGDVVGDGLADIYVVQTTSEENLPDVLFVNRGPGRGFSQLSVPQPGGIGQSVTAIDRDGDGRTAFVVMNGKGFVPGPIRMLEFRER